MRVDGREDCGYDLHEGAKAELTLESYYIRMSRDSALCHPFVTMADLSEHNRIDLTRELHSSRGWVEILHSFLVDNGLVVLTLLAATSNASAMQVDHFESLQDDMFFAEAEDEHDQISELNSSNEPSETEQLRSLRLEQLKLSRAAWNAFKPTIVSFALPDLHELEPWYKPMSALQGTALSLVDSVNDVIGLLPQTLQSLDVKMECTFVSKNEWNSEAERVETQVSALESLLFGTAMESSRSAFALRFGSVLQSITHLKDNIAAMKLDVSARQANVQSIDIDARLHGLAHKAAAMVRAASDHAYAHRIELEDRLSDLESRMVSSRSNESSSSDPLGGVFDSALSSTRAQSRQSPVAATNSSLDANASLGQVDDETISLDWLGIKVDSFAFEDINEILKLIVGEDIDPDQFAGTVDAISIWVHFLSGNDATEKSTNELKATKASGITDPTCCSLIASFRQKSPPCLLGYTGKPVPVGSRYPILHCCTSWEGKPALEGGKKSLLSDVKDAQATAKQYLQDYYPNGDFCRLCNMLVARSHDWWIALAGYISEELLTLGQYGIPEHMVYTLVSDELQVMFHKMFTLRMKMQVFPASRDKHLYLTKAVWVVMQCHMVLDEFLELGFGTHVLISSMFTRFLAEQTGSNFASGVSKKLEDLEKDIASANSKSESRDKAITTQLDKTSNDIKALKTKCGVNPQG
eukprot:CCRYP_004989-RA/>CCRYP_004989-RA protein AED:0.81 eAED:0.69 QI:0/0/0/0.5/1/1/2/0/695